MASLTAGTTFTDGVANDVTAAKLGALVTNATPTSGFIQDRTAETVVAVNDTLLIGDASDSNNLKRMTVANLLKAPLVSTSGTIDSLTTGTTTSTAEIITSGTIATLNSTTGTIATLNSTTGTIATLNSTTGTITNLSATTSTFLGTITGSTNVVSIGSGQIYKDASGNVGIGVTSPTAKLEITGPLTVNTVNQQWNLFSGVSAALRCGSDAHLDFGTITAHSTHLITNGTRNLSVTAAGNVGIGVTSPDSVLSVYANNKTTPAISARYSAAGFKAGLSVYNSLGFPYLSFNSNPVSGTDNATYDINGAASKIDFATGATTANIVFSNAVSGTAGSTISWSERMRIDSSGNCSIGTATALSKLHVHGDVTLSNTTTATTAATGGVSVPATAAGYLTVSINGTSRKIPYYA
jgi:hypothetical protein